MPMHADHNLQNIVPVILLISIILLTTNVVSQPQYTKIIKTSFNIPKIISKIFDKYSLILVENTELLLKPGYPIVPVKVVRLKLPLHVARISVNVTAKYTRLKGTYRLLPAPQPQKLAPKPLNASLYAENPEIYSSTSPYPACPYDYEVKHGIDPATLERVTYLVVRIHPIQYVPATGQIFYATSVNITVNYALASVPQTVQTAVDIAVIAPEAFLTPAQQLAQWKNSTGYVAKVFTLEWITANFPGADAQEKIRNFINYTVNNFDTKYVILLGDSDQIPVRRAYFQEMENDAENPYIETDLYYADLDGTWDTNGDGEYGETEDDIDGYPDVIVGRLPASTLDEASTLVAKITNYNPANEWFRRILLLGTITFDDEMTPEGQILKDSIETYNLSTSFSWKKLYEQVGNLTSSNVKTEINKGYGFVNFAGHGNSNLWYFGSSGYFFNSDVYQLVNGYNTSVIATMACLTGDFADTDVSIGKPFSSTHPGVP